VGLPEPVRSFWYAMTLLGERTRRTAWGAVQADARFPLVWEANNACILERDPSLMLDRVRSALHPALRQAGATHEHLEFWETSVDSPALREARAEAREVDRDAVMVHAGPSADGAHPAVEVIQVRQPDRAFWPWYLDSLKEFEHDLSEPVLNQMVARVRAVFLPKGMRWFVGSVNGHRAGYASVISIGGVAYLDGVVTMPSFRGRGVATATVTAAVRASREAGSAWVFLLTDEQGPARRLYERLGFRVQARVESFTTPLS
jgi:ribosomal protein S18 acetylase RimI-like enzyme